MNNLAKISKGSSYYINKNTSVVINKSISDHLDYKMKIDQAKEIDTLKNEVGSIKNDLAEIKQLLQKALS